MLLAASVGLDAVGIGMLYPLLAHIQRLHHFPTYGLGLMSGGSFFAALIAQVGIGRFLDGRRARRVLLLGLLISSLALVWFALAGDLWQLIASRAVGGVGYGIVGPAALRQASAGVSGEQRGARIGILSSSMMAGIVVGPLAGSVLFTVGGVGLPFEVVAVLIAAVLVATAVDPAGRRAAAAAAATPDAPPPGMRGLAVGPVVAVLLLGAALQLPNGLYDALWSRLLTDRGASELLIGVSLSLFGLPFVALAPFGGRLAERRGPLLAAAAALLAADAFMASYGFVPSPIVITVLGMAEACVQAVAVPGGYAAVARVFPDERAATGQGWFSGAGTAAAGSAAVVGAPFYAALGPGAVFAGGAGVSVALVVAAVAIGRRGMAARPAPTPGARPAVPAVASAP
jgi:MFS family permease